MASWAEDEAQIATDYKATLKLAGENIMRGVPNPGLDVELFVLDVAEKYFHGDRKTAIDSLVPYNEQLMSELSEEAAAGNGEGSND